MAELALFVQENLGTAVAALLAVGGGAAGVSYAIFKALGTSWLDSKFRQRLDELKHQQNIEVARLRVEIDSLLSATIRLQDKDFEILPKAWTLVNEAFYRVGRVVTSVREYVAVNEMAEDELNEWLAECQFTESEKRRIQTCQPEDRAGEHQRLEESRRIGKAFFAIGDLQNFVQENGILMPEQIKSDLTTMQGLLFDLSVEQRTEFQFPGTHKQSTIWSRYKDTAKPLYDSIERQVQSRLRSHASRPNEPPIKQST